MTTPLKDHDFKQLDAMIEQVLMWFESGEVTLAQARGLIAHWIAGARGDDEFSDDIRNWTSDPEALQRWKDLVDQHS